MGEDAGIEGGEEKGKIAAACRISFTADEGQKKTEEVFRLLAEEIKREYAESEEMAIELKKISVSRRICRSDSERIHCDKDKRIDTQDMPDK